LMRRIATTTPIEMPATPPTIAVQILLSIVPRLLMFRPTLPACSRLAPDHPSLRQDDGAGIAR
jgi:hypothetical protein